MPDVRLSGGAIPSNVRAGQDIAASRFWKYGTTENEVVPCGNGEEADGICLVASLANEILNFAGACHSRKETGIYADITVAEALTAGDEIMSDATGQVIQYAYSASDDRRALGKALETTANGAAGRILVYSR